MSDMKVVIEVVLPESVEIDSAEKILDKALSLRIVSVAPEGDVFWMEAYNPLNKVPVYTRKEIMDSGKPKIGNPAGQTFPVKYAVEPMKEGMKVKMIYGENTGQWLLVPHWDEDNPKPEPFDPRPGHH